MRVVGGGSEASCYIKMKSSLAFFGGEENSNEKIEYVIWWFFEMIFFFRDYGNVMIFLEFRESLNFLFDFEFRGVSWCCGI